MSSPLIPQEIYLLERYSSLAYYSAMRDAFVASVRAAEAALEQFMKALPPGYRQQHQSQQPDIVWGEHVLVNLRQVIEGLDRGLEQLSQGDLDGLGYAGNIKSAQAAVNRDFLSDWMPEPFQSDYDQQDSTAGTLAMNIQVTTFTGWYVGKLTTRYHEARGPLDAPPTWPVYRRNPSVQVRSGGKVPKSGIYLPAVDDSCAQLLIAGYEAAQANIGFDPATGHRLREEDTVWTLVERIADSGGGIPGQESAADPRRDRIEGGQPCPRDGWWVTPAQMASRRYIKAGTLMPDFGPSADYGHTIWQWDADQSGPTLS